MLNPPSDPGLIGLAAFTVSKQFQNKDSDAYKVKSCTIILLFSLHTTFELQLLRSGDVMLIYTKVR